jgi:hypothetical protein
VIPVVVLAVVAAAPLAVGPAAVAVVRQGGRSGGEEQWRKENGGRGRVSEWTAHEVPLRQLVPRRTSPWRGPGGAARHSCASSQARRPRRPDPACT